MTPLLQLSLDSRAVMWTTGDTATSALANTSKLSTACHIILKDMEYDLKPITELLNFNIWGKKRSESVWSGMWQEPKKKKNPRHSHFSSTGGACRCRSAAAVPSVWGSNRTTSRTPVFPWWPSHHTAAVARGCAAPFPGAPATGHSPPDGQKNIKKKIVLHCFTLESDAMRMFWCFRGKK